MERRSFLQKKEIKRAFLYRESAELPDVIASKEKAIQTLKGTAEDIVEEEDIQAKIQRIDDKIEKSPLSDEHKKEARESFEQYVSLRAREVNDIDINMEIDLEGVFDDIQMELDEFLEQEDVQQLAEKIRESIRQREEVDIKIRAREAEIIKIDKELDDLARRQASITTKQLPELFERLAYYTKENEKWTFLDEEKIIKDTVSLINAAERISERLSQKIQEAGIKKVLLQQEIYLLKYHKLTISGKNTDELLLQIYDELGDASPRELKEKIEDARKRAIMREDASEFDKHLYHGRYAEALQALNAQNEELTKALRMGYAGAFLSEYDILHLYENSKGKPNFGAEKFLKGGFAARLLEQGYMSRGYERIFGSLLLIRENEDGSLSYVPVIETGEQIRMGAVSVPIKTISKERRQEVLKEHDELEKDVRKAISQNPSIQKVQKAASVVRQRIAPLHKLFQAGISGGKTEDFVALAKKYAREIRDSQEIRDLRADAEQAKRDLEILSGFSVGAQDEFEKEISKYKQAMDQVIAAVDSPHLMRMCEQILRDDFTEDNFKSWFIKDGIVMLSAILVATAAIVITLGTCGLGGVAILALTAGIGTVGGMAGAELGYLISDEVGEAVYGETFQNRSFFGKYLGEEEIYNPETGKYEKITLKQVAKVYGEQFVVGFVTTFALLGLGQVAGQALLKFAIRHEFSLGAKGILSRLIYKLPKMNPSQLNMLEKKGINNILRRIGREFLEELQEEGLEAAAEKADGTIGFFVSVYNCLNGKKVELSLGKYAVVAEENRSVVSEEQLQIISTFSYHSSAEIELTAEIKAKYEAEGFTVEVKDGEIICTKKMTGKGEGKEKLEYENVIIFKKTEENVHMRRIFAEGNSEEDGKSPAEKIYGLARGKGGRYTYDQFAPEGKITLAEFLQRKGFKISGNPESGSFEATRDGQTVRFEQKGVRSARQESARPRIDRVFSPTVSETVSARGVEDVEGAQERTQRVVETPMIAQEHDLPALFQKAKSLIEQHVQDSQDGQILSDTDREVRIQMEWEDFIQDVEEVRKVYGKVYAEILFDFEKNFCQKKGASIKTWAERTAYARQLVREVEDAEQLALRAGKVEEKLKAIHDTYAERIENLPEEQRGENDKISVLKQILVELTPDEQALSPNERRALIRKRFYDRMGEISKDVGKVLERMENYFRENPDATYEQAIEEARKYGFDNLPAIARRKIRIGALRLQRNRGLLRVALAEFTPAELFQNLFGFKPHDEVTLDRKTPFVLYFVVSEVDLFRAHSANEIDSNASRNQIRTYLRERSFSLGGFNIPYQTGILPGLKGLIDLGKRDYNSVPVSRGEAERILTHEERHALHGMFFSLGERYSELGGYERMAKNFRDNLYRRQPAMAGAEFLAVLSTEFPRMLDYYKTHYLEMGKDEIIAYLRDNPTRYLDEVEKKLLKTNEEGGLYDYPASARESTLGGFRPEGADMRERMYDEMTAQYRQEIKDAIRIATDVLSTAGNLEERHAFLAELSSTPIEAWSAVFDTRVQMAAEKRKYRFVQYSHAKMTDFKESEGEDIPSLSEFYKWMEEAAQYFSGDDLVALMYEVDMVSAMEVAFRDECRAFQSNLGRLDEQHHEKHRTFFMNRIKGLIYFLPLEIATELRHRLDPIIQQIQDLEFREMVDKEFEGLGDFNAHYKNILLRARPKIVESIQFSWGVVGVRSTAEPANIDIIERWESFIKQVEKVKKEHPDGEKYAAVLLDMDADVSELDGTRIETWDERVAYAEKLNRDIYVIAERLSKVHPGLADCAGLRGEELLSFVENFNRSHPSGVSADPFVPVYSDGQIILAFDEQGMLVPFAGVDSINIARDSRYARYFPERDRFRVVANDDLDAIRRNGAIDDLIISIRLETKENIVRIPNIRIDEAIHAEALALVDEGLDSLYFTGTNSAALQGIGEDLAILASSRIGHKLRTGERSSQGGRHLQDNVYAGRGHDGLATALTYAYGRESFLVLDNLDVPTLERIIAHLDNLQENINQLSMDDCMRILDPKSDWPREVGTVEEARMHVAERLQEWKENIYFQIVKESVPTEKRFPVLFGFSGKNHPYFIEPTASREYGSMLSGEVTMGPEVSLRGSGLTDIFVPRAHFDDARTFIENAGLSPDTVKIHSIEALVYALRYSDTTAARVLTETVGGVHLANAERQAASLREALNINP